MPREFALLDALVPSLLLAFLLSIVLQVILDAIFGRVGLYRHIWHPSLFRVSVFVCVFGILGLLVLR
jgi:protein AaeX